MTPKNFKFDTAFGKFTHRFLQIGDQSGTSREPVGKIYAPPQKLEKLSKMQVFARFLQFFLRFLLKTLQKWRKMQKTWGKAAFLTVFHAFGVVRKFSRLVPDWFPICKKWCVNLPKAVSNLKALGVIFF